MKALTIYPEFAWAIVNLGKDVENRPWMFPEKMIGQDIAIHAGKLFDGRKSFQAEIDGIHNVMFMAKSEGWNCSWGIGAFCAFRRNKDVFALDAKEVPRGAVVGVATLTGAIGPRECVGVQSRPWAVPGQHVWLLDNVRKLEKPVACRGYQKLWDLAVDDEAQVLDQLNGV
jgi:hypothetical protein